MAAPKPCSRCGVAAKEIGPGRRYCLPCKDVVRAEQRKALTIIGREWQRANRDKINERNRARLAAYRAENPATGPLPRHPVVNGKKVCTKCQRELPVAQFPKLKGQPKAHCKKCQSDMLYACNLRRQFGITAEQYMVMFKAQGESCYICNRAPRKRRLAVDHDHKTLLVRGLLCRQCNQALGHFRDDPEAFRRAAGYLESPPAIASIGEHRTPK